jgi:hypothetical protein
VSLPDHFGKKLIIITSNFLLDFWLGDGFGNFCLFGQGWFWETDFELLTDKVRRNTA